MSDFLVTEHFGMQRWDRAVADEIWAFLTTRECPKIIVAGPSDSPFCEAIRQKMIGIWENSTLLRHNFTIATNRIYLKAAPEMWWCAFRPWPKDDELRQSETIAGVFSKHIMYTIDAPFFLPKHIEMPMRACITGCDTYRIIQVDVRSHDFNPDGSVNERSA